MNLSWANRYIGIPFADEGESLAGCNCGGLVRLVLAERCGIALAPFHVASAEDCGAAEGEFKRIIATDEWLPVVRDARRPLDCVLMTAMTDDGAHRYPGHCGILLDRDTVLHVWKTTHAVAMNIDHRRIRNRVLGFYRHRALAA